MKIYLEVMSMAGWVAAGICLFYSRWDMAAVFYLLAFRFEWKLSEFERREEAKQFTYQRVKRATTTIG